MNRINRMIRNTILEIFIVILLVFISIPVWQSFDLKEYEEVAMYYDNNTYTNLTISDLSDYKLYQTTEETALEQIKPIDIYLSNNTNTMENYSIWLVIDKSSTLDYKDIIINYNNETIQLKNIEIIEDEDHYYFMLEEGIIKGEDKRADLIMWISNNIEEDITNKYLSFDILNNPGQIL